MDQSAEDRLKKINLKKQKNSGSKSYDYERTHGVSS